MARPAYIFLLLIATLFSCTDMDERTAEACRDAAVEIMDDSRRQTVFTDDDGSRMSMAMQAETVTVPVCLPTPAGPQGAFASKQFRNGKPLLRMPLFAGVTGRASRGHIPFTFAKAGAAFVSLRAANYYVFALRRILC